MKKVYLRPAVEFFQLNLSVGIMSVVAGKELPTDGPGSWTAPGRRSTAGPASL